MSDPLITQYAALTERRLHFGRIYWQVIGLHCAGLLAAGAILRGVGDPVIPVLASVFAGGATLLIAFIARRLREIEVAHEALLNKIEETWIAAGFQGVQRSPSSGSGGARSLTNIALSGLGVGLIVVGIGSFIYGF